MLCGTDTDNPDGLAHSWAQQRDPLHFPSVLTISFCEMFAWLYSFTSLCADSGASSPDLNFQTLQIHLLGSLMV
jgi:hypothetical protein